MSKQGGSQKLPVKSILLPSYSHQEIGFRRYALAATQRLQFGFPPNMSVHATP
jgi:hypothetical protein